MKECNTVKQSPLAGLAAYGGGSGSVIFGRKGVSGFQIDRSLRFNTADSAYLNRTPSSASSDRTIWTLSFWIKICEFSLSKQVFTVYSDGSNDSVIRINGNNYLEIYNYRSGSYQTQYISNAQFRDPSAWYHFVVSANGSTSLNAWVNGEAVTWSTSSGPNGVAWLFNNTGNHQIGRYNTTANSNFYLAEVNWIDGQALAATDFGEYSDDGIWDPKEYTGSFGTNGFHLKFNDTSSNAALGTDSSGNGNTWTVNNLVASASAAVPAIDLDGNDSIEYPGPGDGISGDFTMECFFLMDSGASGFQRIFSTNEGSYSDEQTMIRRTSGGDIQFYAGNSSPASHTGGAITAGVWHHAAIVRSSGTVSYYYDGSRLSTDSYSTSFDITKLVVGGGYGSENFLGDVHGARFTLGQALYSGSSYTVPTSAITTTSQGATASNVKVLAGTTSTVNENAGTLGNGTSSGDPTAITASVFGSPSAIDSLVDTPTDGTQSDTGAGGEVSGNYCTWNSLVGRYNDSGQSGTAPTFSNGNLNVSGGQTNDRIAGTFHFNVGQSEKYYWEVTFTGTPASSNGAGVRDYSAGTSTQVLKFWYYDGSTGDGGPATSFTTGDVLGFALDLSAETIDCYKNGGSSVGQMDISSLTSVTPFVSTNSGVEVVGNFGQRPFAHAAPSGYKALCTTNLSDPTIADGSTAFDTVLYSGNGSSQTITGLGFNPDFVWIKTRNDAISHYLGNTVVGVNKNLESNNTQAESTDNVYGYVSATTSDGFTVTAGSGSSILVNGSSKTYVGWAWDAGANSSKTYTVKVVSDSGNKYRFDDFGTSAVTLDLEEGSTYVFDQSDSSNSGHPLRFSTTSDGTHNSGSEYTTGVTSTGTPGSAGAKTTIVVAASAPTLYYYCTNHSGMGGQANTNSTAGASNFDGSIQSTVRANQSAGFSIVTYTGDGNSATIGHGLNAAPEFIIQRRRSQIQDWNVYHSANGKDKSIILNSTAASYSSTTWNNTAPTSSVFSIVAAANPSGQTHVAYCFAPVEGYSAFGKFTANASTDGPFVYLGFRPALVVCKKSSGTGTWFVLDSARDPVNVTTNFLEWNDADAEASSQDRLDFVSNGFKVRTPSGYTPNENSGDVYVYMAWAEQPFKTARSR